MKIKATDNYKLKLNPYELAVIRNVLTCVTLGTGENSKVIYDFLEVTDGLVPNVLYVKGSVTNDNQCHSVTLTID